MNTIVTQSLTTVAECKRSIRFASETLDKLLNGDSPHNVGETLCTIEYHLKNALDASARLRKLEISTDPVR